MNIFDNINIKDLNILLKEIDSQKLFFKKGQTILTNTSNLNIIGIITKGSVDVIRIDYQGNKDVIAKILTDNIFTSKMFDLSNSELSIIALEDTEVIIIDYDKLLYSKNSFTKNILLDNILKNIVIHLNTVYERIQLLTKKTIREKLLEYFKLISNKKGKKHFKLPLSFTSLADYLSVDRSALMREIKHLKEDGVIDIIDKIVYLKV